MKIIQILNRQGKAVVKVQGVRWRTPEAQSKAASILLQAAELSDNDNLHDLKLELHALKMAKEFETLAHSWAHALHEVQFDAVYCAPNVSKTEQKQSKRFLAICSDS